MKSFSQKIEQQKNFEYRDSFRWVLTGLVIMLIICALLTAAVSYKAIFPGQHKYYASMTTGQVIPLPPLSQPVVTNTYLLEWAGLATRAAFNLDFVNYQTQLDAASANFTSGGWKAFSKALDTSGLLKAVQDKKLVMSAVVAGSPLIKFQGQVGGRYMWSLQMPILVTFGSASDQQQRSMTVTMVVSRVPALDTPQGILITDFEAR